MNARKRVVMLVDDRGRDLALASLISHHLAERGVDCFLEPLEAYRAVLGAYRPHLIIFNHLTASHLVQYSQRLAAMGVRTAVLLNEGIDYNAEQLKFNSGKHHAGAHIDHYFCWNEVHREALLEVGAWKGTKIEVVGVPRFDFYFEPWSRIFPLRQPRRGRPRVLLCTNFQVARFWELPKAVAEKFFAAWKDRIPTHLDYWKAVEDNFNASRQVLDFARAIAESGKFELVVRPHPREEASRYADWAAALPPGQREWTRVDSTSNISPLILDCDLEISCETCTTAMESWIAAKPTVELTFARNPLFYEPMHAACNTPCDTPAALPALLERILAQGEAPEVLARRKAHLAKWCNSPDGRAAERVAEVVAASVSHSPEPDWSKLRLDDRRRAAKLRFLRNLGLAYHFDPLMPVKMRVNRARYAIKNYAYQKAIKPADVVEARRRLSAVLQKAA